jgi:Fic family protein
MRDRGELPEPLLAFEGASASLIEVLARVDALQARYQAERTAGRILPNVVEAVRVELTYHSNAIEGSTLSLRDTQLVIEGQAPAGGKSLREIYEARNHDRALRTIEGWASGRPATAPLTKEDLLDVHGLVLADIDIHAAGRFRTERVLIAGTHYVPPGSQRFGELIASLLELSAREGEHAVLRAAELHYNVVAVHPFRDGNGRTARLLMNYELIRRGFPHTIIDVAERGEYLAALDEANTGRWERLALLVARSVERSIQRVLGSP